MKNKVEKDTVGRSSSFAKLKAPAAPAKAGAKKRESKPKDTTTTSRKSKNSIENKKQAAKVSDKK